MASDSSHDEEPDEDEALQGKGDDSGEQQTTKSRSCCSSFKRTGGVGDARWPRAAQSESHGRKIFSLCVLHGMSVIFSFLFFFSFVLSTFCSFALVDNVPNANCWRKDC